MDIAAENPVVAMVALTKASLDGARVVERLRARFGDEMISNATTSKAGVVQFTLENRARIFLTPIPLPLPWTDLEAACTAAVARWPNATIAMRAHREHVLVVLADAPPKILSQRIGLTHVTAAVVATTEAAGVYWGEGSLVHEPSAFIETAAQASLENIPYRLWIDVRVVPAPSGSITLYTEGLVALGHKEIEVVETRRAPRDIEKKVDALIEYLLEQGAIIGDGDTFGASTEERIKVRITRSIFARDEVMRLEL